MKADENAMGDTSRSLDRRERYACARQVPRALLLLLAFIALDAPGCSDHDRSLSERGGSDRGAPSAASSPAAAVAETAASVDGAKSAFAWPVSGDHPALAIDVEHAGKRGSIVIELMPELAPKSVGHVLALARSGFFDGTTFHRVIPGFMIQGGDPNSRDADPTNDGRGGDPTPIPDEFSAAPFERGVVALANRGQRDSSTSQLFIMHEENRDLDGRYNVIGRVREGLEWVDQITAVETDAVGRWGPKDRPIENVFLRKVRVATDSDAGEPKEPPSLAAATKPPASPPPIPAARED